MKRCYIGNGHESHLLADMASVVKDIDMCLFFDRAIVGGISLASFPYAKANNHYLPDFDPKKPTSYITMLDCNNQV